MPPPQPRPVPECPVTTHPADPAPHPDHLQSARVWTSASARTVPAVHDSKPGEKRPAPSFPEASASLAQTRTKSATGGVTRLMRRICSRREMASQNAILDGSAVAQTSTNSGSRTGMHRGKRRSEHCPLNGYNTVLIPPRVNAITHVASASQSVICRAAAPALSAMYLVNMPGSVPE